MYRAITGLAVLAAICFALGCGSSDGGSTSASETVSKPLSKAQFIEQTNAVCKKFRKKWAAVLGSPSLSLANGNPEELKVLVKELMETQGAPILEAEAAELEALAPPRSDQGKIDRMRESFARAQAAVAEGNLIKANNTGFLDFEREAGEYGLEGCMN